jgi:hypothetical protein
LTLYYFVFSAALLVASQIRPLHNFDMLAYVACAKSLEMSDESRLHSFVFGELERAVPRSTFERLTEGTAFRRTITSDETAFGEHLRFFKIRPIYNGSVYLAHKAGVDIFRASYLVSGVSVFLGIWVLFSICLPRLNLLYMYLIPPLGLGFGLFDIARLSTPDGLAFLGVVLSVYLFLKRSPLLLGLLPLCVAIRTDLVIFAAVFAVCLIAAGTYGRPRTATSLGASVALYAFVNSHYGYPGWAVVFHHTLIERLSHPMSQEAVVTAGDYFRALLRGMKASVGSTRLLVYLFVAAASLYAIVGSSTSMRKPKTVGRDAFVLTVVPLSYVILHFAAFPDPDFRYFVPHYVVGTVALFMMISKRDGMGRSTRTKDVS